MGKQKLWAIVTALTLLMGTEKTVAEVAENEVPQSFASKKELFEQKARGNVQPPIVRRGQPKVPVTPEPTPEPKAEPAPEPTPEPKAEPAPEEPKAEVMPEPTPEIANKEIKKSPERLGELREFANYDCSKCTKKICVTPRNMSECMVHCRDTPEILGCLQAKLKVGSETDANYNGSVNATKFLEDLYTKFPLAKYWLDQSLDNKRPTGDAPISPEEENDINAAFQEIETECRMIGDKVENAIKSRKITMLKEPKLLLSNIKKIQGNLIDKISSAKIDRHMKGKTIKKLKDSVDNATLEFKNCFNQGEGAFYKAKKEDFEATEKKTCTKGCSEGKCSSNLYIYRNCLKECSPKYLTKCTKAAQKCPPGDKSQQDPKTCRSIHNQNIAELKKEEEAKLKQEKGHQ